MPFNPIGGAASVTPTAPVMAPSKAVWTVDIDAKSASASILGGVATITRSPKDGTFLSEYVRPHVDEVDGEQREGKITFTTSLRESPNLVHAQAQAETLIRANMARLYPTLMTEVVEAEHAEAMAAAPADPF